MMLLLQRERMYYIIINDSNTQINNTEHKAQG